MINPAQIPDEVVEAAARAAARNVEERHSGLEAYKYLGFTDREAFIEAAWPNYVDQTRAAIAAALNAWPGAVLDSYPLGTGKGALVKRYLDLPLPQEKA